MSDEPKRPIQMVSQPIGKGPFTGISFTALPLVVTGATAEECHAKISAFAHEVRELLEAHPDIRMSKGLDETVLALEIATTVARNHRASVERAIGDIARNQ